MLSDDLYKDYGIWAIGFIFTIALAAYVVYLQRRIITIQNSAIEFARSSSRELLPVLDRSTTTITTVINKQDDLADAISRIETALTEISNRQGPVIGKIELLVSYILNKPGSSKHPDKT